MHFSICSPIHSFIHPEEHQILVFTDNSYIKQFKNRILELLLNYTNNKNDKQVVSKSTKAIVVVSYLEISHKLQYSHSLQIKRF